MSNTQVEDLKKEFEKQNIILGEMQDSIKLLLNERASRIAVQTYKEQAQRWINTIVTHIWLAGAALGGISFIASCFHWK